MDTICDFEVGVPGLSPWRGGHARVDTLWFQCLVLTTQNVNLRRRRVEALQGYHRTSNYVPGADDSLLSLYDNCILNDEFVSTQKSSSKACAGILRR